MKTFQPHVKPLAFLVSVSTLSLPLALSSAWAATTPTASTPTAAAPNVPVASAQAWPSLTSAGARVLIDVGDARARLARHDVAGAQASLARSTRQLDEIAATLSGASRDSYGATGKQARLGDRGTPRPDLVPVYRLVDEITDYVPVATPRQASSGNAPQSEREVDAAMSYLEVDLPLAATRAHIETARHALDAGNVAAADAALKSVQDGMLYVSASVEQPLYVARDLLGRASSDLDGGRADLAQSRLQAAVDALHRAERSADAYTRQAAQALLGEARALQGDLHAKRDVGGRLHTLWQHAQAAEQRAVESVRYDWTQLGERTPFAEALVDARHALKDAEIDLFVGHEPARGRAELQQALTHLDNAMRQAQSHYTDGVYKRQMADVAARLRDALARPAGVSQAHLATAANELDRIVRSL